MQPKNNFIRKIRKYFFSGLVVCVPLVITGYILFILFQFADNLLGKFLWNSLGFYVPGSGILLSVLLIILIGALANRKLVSNLLEKKFTSLPLIRSIYPPFKQLISFVFNDKKDFAFQKVVLVEYPSKGLWSLGFLTNEGLKTIESALGKKAVSVFIPTSPTPLSGFVIFAYKDDLKFPEISITEAFKIIISGGVYKETDGVLK